MRASTGSLVPRKILVVLLEKLLVARGQLAAERLEGAPGILHPELTPDRLGVRARDAAQVHAAVASREGRAVRGTRRVVAPARSAVLATSALAVPAAAAAARLALARLLELDELRERGDDLGLLR